MTVPLHIIFKQDFTSREIQKQSHGKLFGKPIPLEANEPKPGTHKARRRRGTLRHTHARRTHARPHTRAGRTRLERQRVMAGTR